MYLHLFALYIGLFYIVFKCLKLEKRNKELEEMLKKQQQEENPGQSQ